MQDRFAYLLFQYAGGLGGQTLVLDAESKWPRHPAPDYADLREAHASRTLGNRCFSLRPGQSLLACRQGSAVSPSPLRKVFIMLANRLIPQMIWRTPGGRTSTAIDWKRHNGLYFHSVSQLGRSGGNGCPQVIVLYYPKKIIYPDVAQ